MDACLVVKMAEPKIRRQKNPCTNTSPQCLKYWYACLVGGVVCLCVGFVLTSFSKTIFMDDQDKGVKAQMSGILFLSFGTAVTFLSLAKCVEAKCSPKPNAIIALHVAVSSKYPFTTSPIASSAHFDSARSLENLQYECIPGSINPTSDILAVNSRLRDHHTA